MEATAASPDPNQTARSPGLLGRAASQLGAVNAALPVLSIAVYWTVRWGYDGFYNTLGVSPEQVGVSQVTMVSRAAYGIGVLVTVGFVVFIFAVPFLVPVSNAESWKGFLAVTALLVVVAYMARRQGWIDQLLWLSVVPFAGRTAKLLSRYREERHGRPPQEGLGQRGGRTWKLVRPPAVAIGLFVLLMLLVAAPWYGYSVGERYAEALVQGQMRGTPLVPLVLGIVIKPVEVTWLDSRSVPPAVRDLDVAVYLGEADGSATFLDVRKHRTVVVPTGTFVLCKRAPDDYSGEIAQPLVCPNAARATP